MSTVDAGLNLPSSVPVNTSRDGGLFTTSTPGTPAPVGTPEQADAFALLKDLLNQYDLGSLADWAWSQLLGGRSSNEIALDLPNQQAYKDRFGTVIDARRAAGLPAVSAAEILAYESTWDQIAVAAGLPAGFRTRDIAQSLMAADVSVSEANQRVQDGFVKIWSAPVEVRDAFSTFFGSQGDSALAALFLDPDLALPDLERMVGTAQVAGAGVQQGFGIDQGLAGRLAAGGVGYTQAQAGFGQLGEQRALLDETISESSDITEEQGIRGTFGLSGADAETVRKRAARRQADSAGGVSYLDSQTGSGLGSARQS